MSALEGIHYVRPPELKFDEIKNTDEYIEYKITTYKDSKEKNSENIFVADIDSMIFCEDSFKIKMPKKGSVKSPVLLVPSLPEFKPSNPPTNAIINNRKRSV